jgi:hypothetical protein
VAEVALTHAMLALEEGDVPRAVQLLELGVRYDPENGAAWQWLGVALLRSGRYGEAVEALTASLIPGRLPDSERRWTEEMLGRARAWRDGKADPEAGAAAPLPEDFAFAEPVIRPPRWERRLGLEVGRDSNPELLPDEVASGLPLTAGPSRATADEAASLALHVTHNVFQDRRGWSLGWSATGFRSLHRDLGDLDLELLDAAVSVAWGSDQRGYAEGPLGLVRVPGRPGRLTATLQAGGSYARVGGDPYLRSAAAAGSLWIRGPGSDATRLDLEIRDRRYDGDGPPPLQRSGTEISLAASRIFFLGGDDCSLRLGAGAGRWTAGRAFAGSSLEGLAEITAPLPGGWTLFLQGARRADRFAQTESNLGDPFVGAARRDATWRVVAAAERPLAERLRFTVRGMWVERGSNVDLPPGFPLFDYRRTVLAAGLVWGF